MIFPDWITLIFDDYEGPEISGGQVQFVHPNGVIEKCVDRRLWLEGSYESKISVRGWKGHLEISGNPTKFIQGHNLFGCSDLRYLLRKFIDRVLSLIGMDKINTEKVVRLLFEGNARVTQIHLTGMYDCGKTNTEVSQFLKALPLYLYKDRQKSHDRYDSTYYIGEKSRRLRTKIYNKLTEINESKHGALKFNPDINNALCNWVKNKIRIEFELKSLFLKDYLYLNGNIEKCSIPTKELLTVLRTKSKNIDSLSLLKTWYEKDIIRRVFMTLLNKKLKLPENFSYNESNLVELPRSVRGTYSMWSQGLDVKTHLSKASLYRHRNLIFESIGVDIFQPCAFSQRKNVVVPMFKIIEAGPASIPEWAYTYGLVA